MPDRSLLMLIQEVRGKTLKLLDGVTDAESRFAPPGLVNHILWHAGHAVVVNEALGVSAASGQPPVVPDGWMETFSWKSEPAKVTTWPALPEVVDKLRDQQQRLLALVGGLSEGDLDRIVNPQRGRTVRYSVLHGLHDEANHQGEIWLLRKMFARAAK